MAEASRLPIDNCIQGYEVLDILMKLLPMLMDVATGT
jgi:hypothetical protein